MRLRHKALAISALTLMWPCAASADPVRTMLQHSDLPASPQTATLGRVQVKAGDPPAWHTHAGIEIGYILSGQVILSMAGAPDLPLGPGQSFLVPRGTPHASRAIGGDATVISTWVTDTGAPLATPAAAPAKP